jgi:hypothetical protein
MLVDEKFRKQSLNPMLVRQGELDALRAAIRLVTFHAFSIRRKLAEGADVEQGPLILSFRLDEDMDEFYQDSQVSVSEIADVSVFDRRDLDAGTVDQIQQRLGQIMAQGLHGAVRAE